MKIGFESHIGMLLFHTLPWVPKVVRERIMEHFTMCGSGVFTNVLASPVPYRFAGHEIKDLGFWVPCSGDFGLGISVCTYIDKINIGLIVDEGLLPNWCAAPRPHHPTPAPPEAREAGTGTLGQCSRPLATSPNLRTDYARKAVGQARLERKWRFHT